MARPPAGLRHVDRLTGPEELKRRLRVILETLTGEREVESACAELGVSEARFHVLRRQALEGALEALRPKRPGRPPQPPSQPSRTTELEQAVRELEQRLIAAEIREEIALTMPHLVRRGKKIGLSAKRRKRTRS